MKKNIQFIILAISFFALVSAFYMQYFLNMEPCPLCIMQRICIIFIIIFGFISLFGYFKKALYISQSVFAVFGIVFSLRHLWLLSLPKDSVPACLPDLSILIQYFPWQDIIKALFLGTASCANDSNTLLGFALPLWALIYFLIICYLCFLTKRGSK